MKLIRFITVVVIVLTACEEKIDVPLLTEKTELLVVECVITNELRNHLVKVTRPYLQQNGDSEPVSGAAVYVAEDTTVYALTEFPSGSGNYYTPMIRGLFGKLYTLVIQHDGKTHFAQDSPMPVQPLSALNYRKTDNGYTLTLNPAGEDANYIEHFVTWKHTAECGTGSSCDGKEFFYDLKSIDVNEIYKPEKDPLYFPAGSIVIRRKYSVSAAYKSFLRSMLSETQWRGGVFDVQRENVPTNLSGGAIGFFAVCSVVSDTTIVQ